MKLTLVSLLFLLSYSNVYSQHISAGMRVGGSMWNNADAGFNIVNPEIGVFVRSEPIKRVSFDFAFNTYKLKREFAYYDISRKMNCKELNLAIQYNYLRLLDAKLKFYAGLDGSYVFSTLESKSISNPTQPTSINYKNNSSFTFPMLGIDQSISYLISKKLVLISTLSYKTNMGELNGLLPKALAGYTRWNLQTGISYQIN